jgi:hypothetical protein
LQKTEAALYAKLSICHTLINLGRAQAVRGLKSALLTSHTNEQTVHVEIEAA